MGVLKDGRPVAMFDVVFGINDPKTNKFATWRHGVAYGENALILEQCYQDSRYIDLSGFVTSNGIFVDGVLQKDAFGRPRSKELIVVRSAFILKREGPVSKQLSLVE